MHVQTLPLKMWEDIRNQIDPTIAAVSSMLILLPVVWLIVLEVARAGSDGGRLAPPPWIRRSLGPGGVCAMRQAAARRRTLAEEATCREV